MNYSTLNAELSLNSYAGKSDAEIVTLLNAPQDYWEPVPTWEVQLYLSSQDIDFKLNTIYIASPPPRATNESEVAANARIAQQNQIRGLCGAALDILQGQAPFLDLNPSGSIATKGQNLVLAGVITQEELTALINFGKKSRSLSQQLFNEDATLQDITLARLQPKRNVVSALRLRAAAATNTVIGDLATLDAELASGQDSDIPQWADLAATWSAEEEVTV